MCSNCNWPTYGSAPCPAAYPSCEPNCGGAWINQVWTWSPWKAQGCFSDNSTRMLQYCLSATGAITQMNNCASGANTARCQAVAAANGYNVAGLQFYGMCLMCSNCNWAAIGSTSCPTPAWPSCDPVSGGSGCGGAYINQIWISSWSYSSAQCQAAALVHGYSAFALQYYGGCMLCSGCSYAAFGNATCPVAYPACDAPGGVSGLSGNCGGACFARARQRLRAAPAYSQC